MRASTLIMVALALAGGYFVYDRYFALPKISIVSIDYNQRKITYNIEGTQYTYNYKSPQSVSGIKDEYDLDFQRDGDRVSLVLRKGGITQKQLTTVDFKNKTLIA
ncbi:hypothetical protein [Flagellimonas marina]|uniref:DUF1093 domain-containing protein n=1 Tax=Flagellimonas marina TaxID=1775168 RepID=A0ABV8PGA9_9FLAO